MTAKKRGLGRGLDALLGGTREPVPVAQAQESRDYRLLPVDLIESSRYQPRQTFRPEALQELADSIRSQGLVQPVIVRPRGSGRYELIAGERRWRAAQLAGLHEIPAVIRTVADDAAMTMALIENIQREDLNPLEEAQALSRLVEEFGMTHQQAAEAVGRSRAAVSNLLRLLDLADEARRLLAGGEIEMGHARALLALAPEVQARAARDIARHGLSVRAAEALVRRLLREGGSQRRPPPVAGPDITRLEADLGERLGARVALRHSKGGSGTLTIRYHSLDELDGILAHIK